MTPFEMLEEARRKVQADTFTVTACDEGYIFAATRNGRQAMHMLMGLDVLQSTLERDAIWEDALGTLSYKLST